VWLSAFDFFVRVHIGGKPYVVGQNCSRSACFWATDYFCGAHKRVLKQWRCSHTVILGFLSREASGPSEHTLNTLRKLVVKRRHEHVASTYEEVLVYMNVLSVRTPTFYYGLTYT
jgi:hypothetical protein